MRPCGPRRAGHGGAPDIYKERSASQKVPIEDVAKIYAGQIFNEAPSGTYFRKADGSYVKK